MRTLYKLVFCFVLLSGGIATWHLYKLGLPATRYRKPGKDTFVAFRDLLVDHYEQQGDQMNCVLPMSGAFGSSTEYFKHIVTNGWLHIDNFGVFALPGVPSVATTNAGGFMTENNAWCVIETRTNHPPATMPFLISRNVAFGATYEPVRNGMQLNDISGLVDGGEPFGTNFFVVITYGGSLKVMMPYQANPKSIGLFESGATVLAP